MKWVYFGLGFISGAPFLPLAVYLAYQEGKRMGEVNIVVDRRVAREGRC